MSPCHRACFLLVLPSSGSSARSLSVLIGQRETSVLKGWAGSRHSERGREAHHSRWRTNVHWKRGPGSPTPSGQSQPVLLSSRLQNACAQFPSLPGPSSPAFLRLCGRIILFLTDLPPCTPLQQLGFIFLPPAKSDSGCPFTFQNINFSSPLCFFSRPFCPWGHSLGFLSFLSL